jgi:hypothetical protein
MDWMPERSTSEKRAPLYTPRASTPAQNSSPWPNIHSRITSGRKGGTPKYQKNIHTRRGTLRKNST